MGSRRRWSIVCLLAASLAVASGQGAFAEASVDRSVEVEVADNNEAYLTIEANGANNGEFGCNGGRIMIYNRLPSEVYITAHVSAPKNVTTSGQYSDESLPPGEALNIDVAVPGPAHGELNLKMEAFGEDVESTLLESRSRTT